jgi:hypothetical protein
MLSLARFLCRVMTDRALFNNSVILRESGVSSIQEHSRCIISAAAYWITRFLRG